MWKIYLLAHELNFPHCFLLFPYFFSLEVRLYFLAIAIRMTMRTIPPVINRKLNNYTGTVNRCTQQQDGFVFLCSSDIPHVDVGSFSNMSLSS